MAQRKPVIFLSSTRADLQKYRDAATIIFENNGLYVHRQEIWADDGLGNDAAQFSKDRMEEKLCNWYVGIVAFRYGHSCDSERSVTEAEFEHAMSLYKDGFYERVFVLFAENREEFIDDGDIYEFADPEDSSSSADCKSGALSNYTKQNQFRARIKKNVRTLFNSFEDFKSKTEGLLEQNLPDSGKDHIGRLLKSYKDLTASERQLRDSSRAALEALNDLQRYKDLHFLIHEFRLKVIVPICGTLQEKTNIKRDHMDSSGDNGSTKSMADTDRLQPSKILSVSKRKIANYDEDLRYFVHEAEKMRESLPALRTGKISLSDIDNFIERKFLFSEKYESPEEFIELFTSFISWVNFSLDECVKGVNVNSKKFERPSREAINRLDALIYYGDWDSPKTKNEWKNELDKTKSSRDYLHQAIATHEAWQRFDYELSKLDRLRDDLIAYASEENYPSNRIARDVNKFLRILNRLIVSGCDEQTGELQKVLCVESPALLDGYRSNDFETALEELRDALESYEVNANENSYDMRESTVLSDLLQDYQAFRRIYDSTFLHVSELLKIMCHNESAWIDPLYNLLDKIHKSIEANESSLPREKVDVD